MTIMSNRTVMAKKKIRFRKTWQYPVMFPMFLVQKESYVSDGIPVPGHASGAWETHGNDPETNIHISTYVKIKYDHYWGAT